jgi:hypothetical protein
MHWVRNSMMNQRMVVIIPGLTLRKGARVESAYWKIGHVDDIAGGDIPERLVGGGLPNGRLLGVHPSGRRSGIMLLLVNCLLSVVLATFVSCEARPALEEICESGNALLRIHAMQYVWKVTAPFSQVS